MDHSQMTDLKCRSTVKNSVRANPGVPFTLNMDPSEFSLRAEQNEGWTEQTGTSHVG